MTCVAKQGDSLASGLLTSGDYFNWPSMLRNMANENAVGAMRYNRIYYIVCLCTVEHAYG